MKSLTILTLLLVVALSSNSTALAEFTHPGITHSQASIDFVKGKIAADEEPWATAWKKVKASRDADLTITPEPRAHVERGAYNNPDIGSSEFSSDASAAYIQVLCWSLTGDERHAKKAMKIVDAWSGTLKSISNHDARLLVGMSGYKFCIAGELLKHTWNEWPHESQQRFQTMLRDIFYPSIKDFHPSANGNWDASMLQTMLAMGVHLDDQAMFDRAKDYYLKGKGNGAIGMYFKESGQCQETGRDQGHTQMGLEFLSNTCETAWIQGIDLYGALDNRLLKGFEYTAKYNLGFEVPYEPYKSFEGRYHYKSISDKSRGRLRPMYEKVFNHYQNRKGLDAPLTKQAAMKLRSDRGGQRERRGRRRRSGSHLDTLMFADQPGQPKGVQSKKAAAVYGVSVPKPTLTGIRYGEHERNVLDFWRAKSNHPTPLVIVIHGGGWRGGSKEIVHRFVNVQQLLDAEISVAAINYRLIRHADKAGIKPPVKAPLHDAARAVQFVRSKAGEWNINKERIGAAGGSAGACSSLWLTYHDDLADPINKDIIARESTRVWCAAVTRPQTSLDPKQIKEWIPNCEYGGHAFGKENFAEFLAARDSILPWIVEYSPYSHVSVDDPSVYLFYTNPPALWPEPERPRPLIQFRNDASRAVRRAWYRLRSRISRCGRRKAQDPDGLPDHISRRV